MLLYRREVLAARRPSDVGEDLAALNAGFQTAPRDYSSRRYGHDNAVAVLRVTFALVDAPYAAGRRYLFAGTTCHHQSTFWSRSPAGASSPPAERPEA